MNTKHRTISIFVLVISLILAGCGSGRIFGPVSTSTPVPTFTPTIIPTPANLEQLLVGMGLERMESSGPSTTCKEFFSMENNLGVDVCDDGYTLLYVTYAITLSDNQKIGLVTILNTIFGPDFTKWCLQEMTAAMTNIGSVDDRTGFGHEVRTKAEISGSNIAGEFTISFSIIPAP